MNYIFYFLIFIKWIQAYPMTWIYGTDGHYLLQYWNLPTSNLVLESFPKSLENGLVPLIHQSKTVYEWDFVIGSAWKPYVPVFYKPNPSDFMLSLSKSNYFQSLKEREKKWIQRIQQIKNQAYLNPFEYQEMSLAIGRLRLLHSKDFSNLFPSFDQVKLIQMELKKLIKDRISLFLYMKEMYQRILPDLFKILPIPRSKVDAYTLEEQNQINAYLESQLPEKYANIGKLTFDNIINLFLLTKMDQSSHVLSYLLELNGELDPKWIHLYVLRHILFSEDADEIQECQHMHQYEKQNKDWDMTACILNENEQWRTDLILEESGTLKNDYHLLKKELTKRVDLLTNLMDPNFDIPKLNRPKILKVEENWKAFPVILASTKKMDMYISFGDYFLKEGPKLGQDINHIFTNSIDNQNQIQNWLEEMKIKNSIYVHVLDEDKDLN